MRWRFLDKIDQFEAWSSIGGRKTVSLEEYSLLEPFGRKGSFPESLVVESCVQLGRWLVAASSGFDQSCILQEVDAFSFGYVAGPGDVLVISLRVTSRESNVICFDCRVSMAARVMSQGGISVLLHPFAETMRGADMRALWQELHGKA